MKLELNAAISSMHTELAAAEGNEGYVDQCGDVACCADCDSVFWVFGAAHKRWPVVLEAIAKDGENDSAECGDYRTAAGCIRREIGIN